MPRDFTTDPADVPANVPEMPPRARLTANDCDIWMLQLVGFIGNQLTAAVNALSANDSEAADRINQVTDQLTAITGALESTLASIRELAAQVSNIDARLCAVEGL